LSSESLKTQTIEKRTAFMPERTAYSHKGDYGHPVIVASKGKTGLLMTAKACVRAGAGRITIGVPETLMDVFRHGH
jgi:NAD(P)H-hydrate epimerase